MFFFGILAHWIASRPTMWLAFAQLRLQCAAEAFKFSVSVRGLSTRPRVYGPILERIAFVAREQVHVQVGNRVSVDLVVHLDRPRDLLNRFGDSLQITHQCTS